MQQLINITFIGVSGFFGEKKIDQKFTEIVRDSQDPGKETLFSRVKLTHAKLALPNWCARSSKIRNENNKGNLTKIGKKHQLNYGKCTL